MIKNKNRCNLVLLENKLDGDELETNKIVYKKDS